MTEPGRLRDAHYRIARPVWMGVIPGQAPAVAHRAAELAYSPGVELVCAYVLPVALFDDGAVGIGGDGWCVKMPRRVVPAGHWSGW